MPAARLATSRPPPKPTAHPIRTRVWSLGRLLVLMGALVVTFGTFFLMALRVTTHAREVKVPDLRGRSITEATASLASAGLTLRVESRRADPKVPVEHVLAQDPDPGTVIRRQRPVRVRVSDGQKDPVLPSVIGQAERTAEVMLAQEQVQIGDRDEIRTASYPAGTVVAQDPGAKNRASTVALLINRGDQAVTYVMPDLIGAQGARAVDILRRKGFRVTVSAEVPYPGLPPGIVIRQTPQAGFQIGAGEAVVVEISK